MSRPWYFADVRFDHAAAADAIAACGAEADTAQRAAAELLARRAALALQWRGGHRARWDEAVEADVARLRATAADLRTLSQRIAGAADAAHAAQRWREGRRRQWVEEQRALAGRRGAGDPS